MNEQLVLVSCGRGDSIKAEQRQSVSFQQPVSDIWVAAGNLPQWGNGSHPNLSSLVLPNNGFSGSLPESWVSLASLSDLTVMLFLVAR